MQKIGKKTIRIIKTIINSIYLIGLLISLFLNAFIAFFNTNLPCFVAIKMRLAIPAKVDIITHQLNISLFIISLAVIPLLLNYIGQKYKIFRDEHN
jgi:hypothetical protein